jgi:glutaminase
MSGRDGKPIVSPESGEVNIPRFLDQLKSKGILGDDPRIRKFLKILRPDDDDIRHGQALYETDLSQSVSKEVFTDAIEKDKIEIFKKVFLKQEQLTVCDFGQMTADFGGIYEKCLQNETGKLPDYIPQLAKQNPDLFGVSACTIDGQRLAFGDTRKEFCLQACANAVTYCTALEENGLEKTHRHCGFEPSGVAFNALQLNKNGLPHNPMINAGAIMMCSLIKNDGSLDKADRYDYICQKWKAASGHISKVGFDMAVYLSEQGTADRNNALAHFMHEKRAKKVRRQKNGVEEIEEKNTSAFPENTDIQETLELYFQCCSLLMDSDGLSVVAATLANGGVCPLTKEKVFDQETVKYCLSLMASCGMYDYSGQFAFKVGLPAKSGVGGGIFVVIPNIMGICTFSPKIDEYGNSSRGLEFIRTLSQRHGLHTFDQGQLFKSLWGISNKTN